MHTQYHDTLKLWRERERERKKIHLTKKIKGGRAQKEKLSVVAGRANAAANCAQVDTQPIREDK